MTSDDPAVGASVAGCCVAGTWRNGLWMVWSGKITVDALRTVDAVGRRLAKMHPRYFTVSISLKGIPMPDADARNFAAKLVKQRESSVIVSTTVLEGDGFWMSTSRMITSAIFKMTSQRLNKVCATLDEAALILTPHVEPHATAGDVLLALRAMREAKG